MYKLKNIIPTPLSDLSHDTKSVWGNEVEIPGGKKILLNASSGKGKSTFSNILYGLRNDYTGEVLYKDQNILNFDLNTWIEIRRYELSAVFQDLQLFGELTTLENLQIKNELTHHKSDHEILEMIELLGIADKKNQTCKTMSLGQQQRVAIIRALLLPYKFLILDEPFSHLDEENAAKALALINRETEKNNAGYVLTTLGSHHGFSFDLELNL